MGWNRHSRIKGLSKVAEVGKPLTACGAEAWASGDNQFDKRLHVRALRSALGIGPFSVSRGGVAFFPSLVSRFTSRKVYENQS